MTIADALVSTGLATTRAEARRLAVQGGVHVNGVKVASADDDLEPALLANGECDLRVGGRRTAVYSPYPKERES